RPALGLHRHRAGDVRRQLPGPAGGAGREQVAPAALRRPDRRRSARHHAAPAALAAAGHDRFSAPQPLESAAMSRILALALTATALLSACSLPAGGGTGNCRVVTAERNDESTRQLRCGATSVVDAAMAAAIAG